MTDNLEHTWKPLATDEKHEMRVRALDGARKQLDTQLDKIRVLCSIPEEGESNYNRTKQSW